MILVFYFDDNTIESIITPEEQKEIESLTFGIRIKLRSRETYFIKRSTDDEFKLMENTFYLTLLYTKECWKMFILIKIIDA